MQINYDLFIKLYDFWTILYVYIVYCLTAVYGVYCLSFYSSSMQLRVDQEMIPHVFFAHQRLERPHAPADIEADEHSAEVKDIN